MNIQDSELTCSKLTLFEQEIEANGHDVIDLTFGYPDGLCSAWIHEIFHSVTSREFDVSEVATCKKNIVAYFQRLFSWEHVLLASTASEALLVAMDTAIHDAGDEVILLDNGFDTYAGLISTCKGVPVFARRADNETLDVERIRECITKNTRAILITQPENPLGNIHDREVVFQLMSLCVQHDLVLIADCSFFEVSPWGNDIPLITKLSQGLDLDLLLIGDTGKIISYSGLRLGTLAVSDRLHARAVERLANLFFRLDNVRLGFLSAVLWDPRLVHHCVQLGATIRRNHQWIEDHLDSRIKVALSEATSMILVAIDAPGFDDTTFALELLTSERVAIVPGSMFYKATATPPTHRLRIALSRPHEKICEATLRLNRFAELYFDSPDPEPRTSTSTTAQPKENPVTSLSQV